MAQFRVRRLLIVPEPIVDCLHDNAYQDTLVQLVNEKEGDQLAIARDVGFKWAPERELEARGGDETRPAGLGCRGRRTNCA